MPRKGAEAEVLRRAVAAEKIAEAKAFQEAYFAQQEAELARAAKERVLEADVIIKTEIESRRKSLRPRYSRDEGIAKGEADAIFTKMEAEARELRDTLKAGGALRDYGGAAATPTTPSR